MTEYDYSPGALEKYKAKQASVGRWASTASSQSSHYTHPFQGQASTAVTSASRPQPTRSNTAPSHVSSHHSGTTIRAPTATVVSNASRRSQTIATSPSSRSRAPTTFTSAPTSAASSRSSSRHSAHSSHHPGSQVSASHHPGSHVSSSHHTGSHVSSHHTGSHVSSQHTGSHVSSSSHASTLRSGSHVSRSSRSSSLASGTHISGAPSIHSSARSPTHFSGAQSVAPSDSISQAGSRVSKASSARRSATLPASSLASSATAKSLGAYGPPDMTTNRPFKAHGHVIIPQPGQTLDVYYV